MATGGKGIHVVVPLTPRDGWDDVKDFAEAMARTIAAEEPGPLPRRDVEEPRRKGKIFIDYLRNGRGATAIAPFSTRARKGAPVAWPVAWTALAKLDERAAATVETAAAALKRQKSDPWAGYFDVDQVLPLERLRRPAIGLASPARICEHDRQHVRRRCCEHKQRRTRQALRRSAQGSATRARRGRKRR